MTSQGSLMRLANIARKRGDRVAYWVICARLNGIAARGELVA